MHTVHLYDARRISFVELHHDTTGSFRTYYRYRYAIFVTSKDVHPHLRHTFFFASNLHPIVLQNDVLPCWSLHDGKGWVQRHTFWRRKVNTLNVMMSTKSIEGAAPKDE
jgi:hypothetical protein